VSQLLSDSAEELIEIQREIDMLKDSDDETPHKTVSDCTCGATSLRSSWTDWSTVDKSSSSEFSDALFGEFPEAGRGRHHSAMSCWPLTIGIELN
jgi:hypothetical protein